MSTFQKVSTLSLKTTWAKVTATRQTNKQTERHLYVNISKVSNCEKLPHVGFEPTTSGLQDRCANQLRQRGTEFRAR